MASDAPDRLNPAFISAAQALADKRQALLGTVIKCEDELNRVRKRYQGALEEQQAAVETARSRLQALIEAHPEQFEQPKSAKRYQLHFGYRQSASQLEIPDETKTQTLILKHFPDWSDQLLIHKVSINKAALRSWPEPQLKKISARRIEGKDEPFIKDLALAGWEGWLQNSKPPADEADCGKSP